MASTKDEHSHPTYGAHSTLIIQDWKAPFAAVVKKRTKGYFGVDRDLPNQFVLDDTLKEYGFKFKVYRNGTLTGVIVRTNTSVTYLEHANFDVEVYDADFNLLAESTQVTPRPQDVGRSWAIAFLNQTVEVTEGDELWVVFTDWTTDSKRAIYYENTTTPDTAYYRYAGGSREYFNATVSAYGVSSKIEIFGYWRETILALIGPSQGVRNQSITLYSKWWEIKGLSKGELWTNNTGTWQIVNTTDFSGAIKAWFNYTFIINATADLVNYEFRVNTTENVWASSEVKELWTCTPLEAGWNKLLAWPQDVGQTLGAINASLNADGLDWLHIVLELSNGSRYVFVYGFSINMNVLVESEADTLWIWCNVAGKWYHTY